MLKKYFEYIFELIKVVLISLIIIIPIRYFLVQPFYVKGASMEPNFYDHEYLIIDEIGYRFNAPSRGDIIVFRYPLNPQEYFIKRVIGLPGEKIQIKDGGVKIFNKQNPEGFILNEDYLKLGVKTNSLSEDIIDLKEDEYYVLGDNRTSSKDSRSFGSVDKSYFVGRVMLRGWPFDRAKLFKSIEYNNIK
ncbi:MAG: signal peptidase I [Candidatus Falkowbacteria bacterium]|nr:signal peptidase I [Candidatus Falkowbacteria bacterium]